jgi:hypothetical protein
MVERNPSPDHTASGIDEDHVFPAVAEAVTVLGPRGLEQVVEANITQDYTIVW